MIFFESSALTGDSVQEVFSKCARQIMSKIEAGPHSLLLSPSLSLSLSLPLPLPLHFLPLSPFLPFSLLLFLLSLSYVPSSLSSAGVIDPQLMGSGVQHGDSRTAREIAKESEPPKGCCG